MRQPVLDIGEVARLEEQRQARGMVAVAGEWEPIAGGVMAYAEPGSWANQAVGMGMTGAVTGDDMDRLIAFYVSRGVEPRIELCPFAHESLLSALAQKQFVVRDFEHVVVHRLVRGLQAPAMPQGVSVEIVDPDDEPVVRECVRIAMAGFGSSNREADEVLMRRMMQNRSKRILRVSTENRRRWVRARWRRRWERCLG